MQKKITSFVVFALCVVITLATVVNVFGDNDDVVLMAEKAMCEDTAHCKYSKTAMARTPLGQTFTFQGDGKTVEVKCRRAFILFGEYSCEAPKK